MVRTPLHCFLNTVNYRLTPTSTKLLVEMGDVETTAPPFHPTLHNVPSVPPVLEGPLQESLNYTLGSHVALLSMGETLTLECRASGVPTPQLSWLKDGVPLKGSDTRLQLPDVAPSDAGLYSCVASNQAGSSTKSFNLTVLGKAKNNPCF
uniref:Ig-like domain-containing protein n=1 Tax=Salarias fasciatus TaxID=181472 RepID=A0A672JP42_SALFA